MIRRVVIYGNGGSGKSTLARTLAITMRAAHVELDALAFTGDYEPVDPAVLRRAFEDAIGADRWVVEGMHRDELTRALQDADAFVWLDLPLRTVARRLVQRVLVQLVTGRRRHGRRTTLRSARRLELPFVRKTVASHARRRAHGARLVALASSRGVTGVHLRSARQARRWVRDVVDDQRRDVDVVP